LIKTANTGSFKRLPIMGILRGIEVDSVAPVIEAVAGAGLETIEVTMNTARASAVIRKAVKAAGKRLAVGAGTVLTVRSLEEALNAGATFIVMPAFIEDVVKRCVKLNIPSFPGALTPQEIYNAWRGGASMVKVFPSGFFGPSYFREIKGPFDDIRLLACGGVTSANLAEYFSAGADAVAFGSSVFRKELLLKKEYGKIAEGVRSYISAYRAMERAAGR